MWKILIFLIVAFFINGDRFFEMKNLSGLRPLIYEISLVKRFFKRQYLNKSGYVVVFMEDRKKKVPTLGAKTCVTFHRWYYCWAHRLMLKDIRGDDIHHLRNKLDFRLHCLTRVSKEQHNLLERGIRKIKKEKEMQNESFNINKPIFSQ